MKDILLGAADQYNWAQIYPWAASARESGFTGDIFLVTYRVTEEVERCAEELNVNVYPVEHTPQLTPIQHAVQGSPTQAHNLRFFHFWELMLRLEEFEYNYAIITDVSDVIFQKNPSTWLDNNPNPLKRCGIIAPSEAIKFEQEEWNKNNMIQGYGQVMWDLKAKDYTVYNVGTIAGPFRQMRDLAHTLFSMTEGRYYPSDQSGFNILINTAFSYNTLKIPMDMGWAAQIGTTNDPTKAWLWDRLIEPRPTINDGKVYNSNGELFTIIHQWNRNPELKKAITERYVY